MVSSLPTPRIRGILLDIEGTTTPISFVHEVLFSYARSHIKTFLAKHFDSPDVLAELAKLREEHALDRKLSPPPPELVEGPGKALIDSLVAYINWLIDRDRKSTALKSLQGKIWKEGYLDGTLKAQVFTDVPLALRRWRHAGLRISIFSSGSSLAQKLLFAHTEAGDLTEFIDNYFDTTVGSKQELKSYRRIAELLRLRVNEVLFVSDVVGELEAAHAADMQVVLCVRPGNQPQPFAERYRCIQSLATVLETED
jgi:enolase-phosphatase E1